MMVNVPAQQAVPMVPAVPMSIAQPMPTQPEAPTPGIIPRTMEIGSIPPGMDQKLWSAKELEGTFCACCCPLLCACYKQTAKDDDVLVANGWCFFLYLIPCPISGENKDKMYRVGNTNSFAKKGETNDPETYSSQSSWSSAGGLGCGCKVC